MLSYDILFFVFSCFSVVVSTAQAGIFFKLMRSHVRERKDIPSPLDKKLEDELKMLKKFYQKHRDAVKKDRMSMVGDADTDIDIDVDVDLDDYLSDESDEEDGVADSVDSRRHESETEDGFDLTR